METARSFARATVQVVLLVSHDEQV